MYWMLRTDREGRAVTDTVLDDEQLRRFTDEGYVRVGGVFSRETAERCLDIMWPDTRCDRHDRSTWTKPVVRLGGYGDPPFREAAGSPRLRSALDQVVGRGRWEPTAMLGTVPVRFPHPGDPGDAGWHVEGSFVPDGAHGPYWLNVRSRARALLMLFLFNDVGEDDAPTRIRVGSHLDVPAVLEPAGEAGMSFIEAARRVVPVASKRPLALATGRAGDVFLCHPFLVHAAQPNRGSEPRFMAQPPLLPAVPLRLERDDGDYSLVEAAIRTGLGR